MRTSTLLARNLAWYWRTNLAVVLGVATATAVLAGALLVGDSVRASLRDLVLSRLGNTESVVSSGGFFREKLAEELGPACPLITLVGVAAHEPSGRRSGGVQVYGVDERFWKFQGEPAQRRADGRCCSRRLSRRNWEARRETRFCCALRSPRRFLWSRSTGARRTPARRSD